MFYNTNNIKIHAVKFGNIEPSDIRPYQVLYCENLSNKQLFVIINLHNGHLIDNTIISKVIKSNTFGLIVKKLENISISGTADNYTLKKNIK